MIASHGVVGHNDVSGATRSDILESGGKTSTTKSLRAQIFRNFFHRPSHRSHLAFSDSSQSNTDGSIFPPCPLFDPKCTAESYKPISVKMQHSSRTDIGGMSENQDECFVWCHEASNSLVIGVLDGHGRDVGKLAAVHVKNFMQDWLSRHWSAVLFNPAEAFKSMFADSHSSMLVAFQQHLTAEGWTVKDAGGYLMKRRSMSCPWTCVHGGTSGSLIALVEGKMLISANVGDSSALMACRGRTLHQSDLIQRSLWPEYGGIIEHPAEAEPIGNSKSGKGFSVNQTLLLTTDHSPESLREYCRLTTTHPCPQNHKSPQLSIVYDSPTPNKQRCPPVFQINSSGNPYVTGTGRYYKNVRREWASLVATPSRARFQDALAFTRSLGDFHLQCYGVSHVPDVHTLDLASVFLRSQEEPDLKSASDESSPKLSPEDVPKEMICCIVACSDGVWDNWDWSDVSNFVLDPQRIYQVSTSGSCDAIAQEFMTENMRRSVANFGNQADNATAVICYIFIEQP